MVGDNINPSGAAGWGACTRPAPSPPRGEGWGEGRGLENLRLPFGFLGVPSTVAPHPAPDHHAAAIIAAATAAPRVEALGHAVELGAPGDVLLEPLLGLPGDADSVLARLFAEPGDAAGGRAFLFLRRGAELGLGQRADDHDLVVLDGDLHSREPAVREPTGKPTFDRSELFLIHVLHNYTVKMRKSTGGSGEAAQTSRKLTWTWE